MTANTKASLNALYKEVYADSLESMIPDFGLLMKKISFSNAKKTGRDFVAAVKLTNEHGFTYGAGLQTLTGMISAANEDARVRGSSLTLQTGFSYDAAANMVSGGKEAFISGTKYKFLAMTEAVSLRLEQQMLYGGSGLAVISDTTPVDATHTTLLVTAASWASGIWAGAEGAPIDFYNGSTKINTTAALFVTAVDSVNKTVTVSGAAADITAIDALAAGSYTVHFTSSFGNEMVGLRSIASNTGTLYGIDASGYSLWKGNTVANGGVALTLKKIYDSLVPSIGKGLMEDVTYLVSPATFSTLANDEAALRRYNTQAKKAERGFGEISFTGPSGQIDILVHPMVRESEAMWYPTSRAERIGATDVTFKTPGTQDEMFRQLDTQTGFECRLYSEQALFLPCPAKCGLVTGIVNS